MNNIRYDMSQFYPMKAVLEQLFGRKCYRRLKETATLRDWKTETQHLLRGIELALNTTVEVADSEWRDDVKEVLALGRSHVSHAKSITDLFAHLSATLVRLVFLQLGQLPYHASVENVPLAPRYWQLNGARSVQYVQSKAQVRAAKNRTERRKAT